MKVDNSTVLKNAYEATASSKAETDKTKSTEAKKTANYGKTIGDVKLSKEAASYANAGKMVVLIDEEKVERMATDESYRKQYEGIIRNAASGLSQLKSQIEASGQSSNVKGYGMKSNDGGTASFFALEFPQNVILKWTQLPKAPIC